MCRKERIMRMKTSKIPNVTSPHETITPKDFKMCPIRSTSNSTACIKNQCQWWIDKVENLTAPEKMRGRCAVVAIAIWMP